MTPGQSHRLDNLRELAFLLVPPTFSGLNSPSWKPCDFNSAGPQAVDDGGAWDFPQRNQLPVVFAPVPQMFYILLT